MSKIHQIITLLSLLLTLTNSYNISSCIPNTSCKCYLTQYSLTFLNCSYTLTDLPIFNSKNTINITKLVARNALTQWPFQLCNYKNIQILDLSGSYFFNSQVVDFSCLSHLIHLNLSNTQINQIPTFEKNLSDYLQILDLSNNHIKILDSTRFHSLNNLISLLLQNNPIESIEHLEDLFSLPRIESINLISSEDITLKQTLTLNQWIDITNKWNSSSKSFIIRSKNIPLQSIILHPDYFASISIDSMKIIIKTLINSTFITLANTPKCNCAHLRSYQRILSYVDYQKKYSSALFQSTTCLMSDGITQARLFDRRTYVDLRCPLVGKISFFPLLHSSSSSLNNSFVSFFIFYLLLLY